jgi:hypothetical protein
MEKKVKKGRNRTDKLIKRTKGRMGRKTHVIAFFSSLSSIQQKLTFSKATIHVCLSIV